jgi:hypothetical protein
LSDNAITSLIKQVRFFWPGDTLRRAVGIMQSAGVPALPVIDNGRVVGVVSEANILAHLLTHPEDSEAAVSSVMTPDPVCGNIYMAVLQVADVISSAGVEVLPVIDEFGSYRGVVTRADVLASMLGVVKPPQIAGLATPLGVRLTTGGVTAGAGNLGLFLSGVVMTLFWIAGLLAIRAAAVAFDSVFGTTLSLFLQSPSTGTPVGALGIDLMNTIAGVLAFLLMLFFIRISPIAAYHAAEHQVVHTIEAGEPLTSESVARFPRAHPRCGTNLMVIIALVAGIVPFVDVDVAVLVGLLLLLTGWWRSIGYYLQQYFTTRRAGEKYIQNGIKVGEELLARVARGESRPVYGLSRLWGMGLPQVILGFSLTFWVANWIARLFGIYLI